MYHLLFGQHIQAQCRLIQENYGRIVQKQHRNIRPHALSKAQFPGKCVKEVFQIEQFRYKCQIFFVYCIRDSPYLLFPFEAGNDGMIPPGFRPLSEQYANMTHEFDPVCGRIETGHRHRAL